MGVNRPKTPAPVASPPKTVPDDPNRHDAYGITKDNSAWLKNAPKQSQERVKNLWGRYGTPSQVDLERAYAAGNAVPTPPGAKSSDYWLDPYRIARYHNVLKNAPAGYQPPEWMDAQAIESAYKYLEYRNGGKPWYKWKALSDDDPAAQWLKTWKLPDPVDAPDREFKLLQQQEPDTPYTFDDVEGTSGISDEEWAKLPGWQKVIIPLLSSGSWQAGAAMGAATTLPFGAVASIASANPIPLLASAGLGAGLGALFGLVGDNAPVLAKALMALDAPAEGIERVAGLGWQIAGSLSDPDKYGSVMTVLNNLPAAWKAGTIGYDVIPGGISGEAVQLGKAEPVALDENMIGLAAIVGLRNDIQAIESGKSKESLEDIYQKYRDVLGFAGMGTDLLGHMVLDPLNLAGMGGKGAIKGVAKLSKNTQLLDAVQSVSKSDGVSRVLQMYKIELGKLPDEQAVKMGKLNQWLAGIAKVEDGKPVYKTFDNTPTVYDKAGILKWIPGVNIPWLLHLDPKSRALEAVYTGIDNLRLMMVDEPNPVNINKTVMAAGNILPENAGNVTLAGFMKGKDGAVFPLAMRDAAPRLNELLDNLWLLPADKRLFYTDLAKALDVDIYKLVKDIDDYRGKPTLTAWLKNRLNEADTPEAKNLIARMDAANDPITPGRILNDIDEYKKGNFVMTADEYKANMVMVMDDILSDWAVKFYGVKPDALLGRLAHTIKTAQSFVLLGGNPNYLFNNLFDNIAAMAYSGVFKLSTRGSRDNFWSRLGFEPLRRKSGVTSAEVADKRMQTVVGGKIIEASTKEGKLTAVDNAIHKATDKIGVFTKLSGMVESESSDMVMSTTTKRFVDQNWKAGKGFDRIDPAIESSLKALGIDVEKEYYRAINGSLNDTELNANVWQGMKKYALEKMADEGQLEIIEQAGLKDFLNERLAKAVDDDGVSQAFKETFAEMQKNMDDTVAQNAGYTIEHAFHETLLEGFQATISKFDEIAEEMGQFWNKYSHSLDDVWKEADKIPDKRKRAAFKKRKFDEFDKDWQRQKKLETQKMMGVIKAFGGDQAVADSRTATYLNERINLNLVWDNYYYTRRKMMNLYYMARYDGDRSALVDLASMIERALGPEVMKELDSLPSEVLEKNIYSYIKRSMSSLYDDAMDLEMDFQTRIDDVFVDMFDQQFPGGRPAAEAWRQGTRDIRTMMSEAQRYFRDGKAITQLSEEQAALLKGGIDNILHGMTLDDMSREDRSAAWLRFNEEVYRPLINDLMLTNQRKAADMYRTSVQANSGVPIQAMTPQNMTPKQATGYIRRIAAKEYGIPTVTADGVSLDQNLLTIINGLEGNAFKSLDEVDADSARQAFDAWGAQRVGITPEEFARQRHGMTLDELRQWYSDNKTGRKKKQSPPKQDTLFQSVTDKIITRQEYKDFVRKQFAKSDKQAEQSLRVLDGMANYWAQKAGKTPDQWWTENIGDLVYGGDGTLFQSIDTPEFKNFFTWDWQKNKPGNKPSIVVDENGKPKPVYHGTTEQFDTFTLKYMRQNGTSEGIGYYFTDSKSLAEGYTRGTGNLVSGYLNIQKAIEPKQRKFTKAQVRKILLELHNKADEGIDGPLSNYGDIQYYGLNKVLDDAVKLETEYNDTDIDLIASIGNSSGMHEEVNKIVTEVTGYDGIVVDWPHTEPPSKVYIAFNPEQIKSVFNAGTFDPNNPNILFQEAKGAVSWMENGKAVMHAFEKGDVSTAIHESTHIYLKSLVGVADDDIGVVTKWLNDEYGYKLSDGWASEDPAKHRQAHEAVARGFEKYLQEGKAPKPQLQKIFDDFKRWLTKIYKEISGLEDVKLNDDIRQLFGKWVSAEPENTPPPAVINPLGTADAHRTTPPIEVMQHQDWMDNIRPALEDLEAKYHSTESNAPTGFAERIQQAGRANGMGEEQITELIRKVKAHTAKVGTQQKDLIYTAYKYGLSMRDHVLLNYSRRTNFDNAMNLIFPYSFWATNAGQQWALRAIDRPAMMANFARLKEFQQNTVNRPGFPTRLRNKIGIYMPFLPDWMGETVFIDPLRRIFPFNQFFQPIDRLKDQNNMTYKKAITILQDMVNSDEVSQAEALQAYNTQTGELWQKVVTQAKAEIDGDIANPFDVISLMYGPSLPIQWAYQTIMGRQDQIGQLPLTRTIQNATVALGIGGPAGFNLEAPIRKALGLPEVDQFYDYRVDKALSDLTADGVIKPDDAVRAMIERKGEIYDQARERVAKEGLLKFAGAPLSLDFFPEGEQHQRALRDEYSKAIDAYANGDTEAINEFFEQYPEYDVQLQAWRDPEERLRRFLRSQIWESYNALEGPNKGVIRNRFGELFQDAFINKATRSYDSIDTQTLAMWAGALNNKVPESKEFIQPATIEEMKPLISETIPGTEMYEPEQAQAVKEYWDEREKQFPGVLDLQTIYYGSSKADRRNLITIYPQLKKYWEWNKAYKANHPLVADYVEKQSAIYDQQDMQSTLKEIDPIMLKALSQYTTGIPLGNGARTYLYQVWVDNGRPLGTFEKYLDSLANILADY